MTAYKVHQSSVEMNTFYENIRKIYNYSVIMNSGNKKINFESSISSLSDKLNTPGNNLF